MLTEKSKPDFAFLPLRPRKLISLWQMIRYFALEGSHYLEWLNCYWIDAKSNIKLHGAASKIDDDENLELLKVLGELKIFCGVEKCDLENSRSRLENFNHKLGNEKLLNTVIESEIDGLMVSLREELNNRWCAYIPDKKVEFFECEMLFGFGVLMTFGEAKNDIKDAGNCLAADLNTAAVFHLMRVAEYGLRALAAKLGVKAAQGKRIDEATWGQIIKELHGKIDSLYTKSNKTKKEKEDLAFYRLALNDCSIFKPIRDDVMHIRGYYNEHEALGLFKRVKEFMKALAARGVKRPRKEIAALLRRTK
jgi:hypothetical protein